MTNCKIPLSLYLAIPVVPQETVTSLASQPFQEWYDKENCHFLLSLLNAISDYYFPKKVKEKKKTATTTTTTMKEVMKESIKARRKGDL